MRKTQLLLLALVVLTPNVVNAESCQELARAFAKNSVEMSDTELGRLRTCVTEELRKRTTVHRGAPPAAAAPSKPAPPLMPTK